MRSLLLVAVIFGLCSCGGAPQPTDVAADRATFDAVAPAYLGYVSADPALTAEQKSSRADTVATWGLRIRKREEAIR